MNPRLLIVALAASLSSAALMLLLLCSAVPLMAQQTAPPSGTGGIQPPATTVTYPIGCSSATACKKGYVPIFDSAGGSATVSDSIVSQSGPTITIAGSATATEDLNVGGQITANTVVTTDSTGGVNSAMTGSGNSIAAITGSATATGAAGYTFGVFGQSASNTGRGVFGLSTGSGGVGVIGENNNGPGIGVVGKALPGSTGVGVYGSGPIGFQTDSNVQQSRTAGGWVKAMIVINGLETTPSIVHCFNSTLSGSAATTPPCGFTTGRECNCAGSVYINFGFEIDDRFWSVTADDYGNGGSGGIVANAFANPYRNTDLVVDTYINGGGPQNIDFRVVIY